MRNFIQNQYIYFAVLVLMVIFRADTCFAEFTIEDEKKLGKEFYEKLEENQLILNNKILKDYVTKIGNLILSQSTRSPFQFNFYIINSAAINAFATPGGYIYINKGLIMAAENEAELAGVIAHEIGHANARHIASIIEKSQKLNMAALAALLAGAFLGGGQTSAAIASFSIAGASSLTLKYMREHEEEADRLGMEYLVRAGFYPTAMIDFLKIMKKHEFISKTMPSYLLTHPGTDDRIIYMDALILTKYRQGGEKNIIDKFNRIQSLIPLDALELSKRYKQLENSLQSDPNNAELLYSFALAEDQLGHTDASLQHFHKALSLSPDDADILKDIGLLYLKKNQLDLAENYLTRAIKLNPANDEIVLAMGKTYFASFQYQKALDCYVQLQDRSFDDIDINYFIAMTYGKLNHQGEFHYYFGLYLKKEKKKESALFHFKEALKFFPHGSERNDAINQAIKELNTEESLRLFRKPPP
jgi:beta-barrel assembly-enhancing protease